MDILNNRIRKPYFTLIFGLSATMVMAQNDTGLSDYMWSAIILFISMVALYGISTLLKNLMTLEAEKAGIDTKNKNFGLFPEVGGFFATAGLNGKKNEKVHYLKQGFDIKLRGEAEPVIKNLPVSRFALMPTDFYGMSPIPKIDVEIGQNIKAGDVLFYDKKRPEVKYVSPVSGEFVELRRGEKRSIAELIILADKEIQYKKFNPPNLETADKSEIIAFLAESGGMTLINQRPFDIVPGIDDEPDNIFISTFDTAPLAPDMNFVVSGRESDFQAGLDVLVKLTKGKVYLGINAKEKNISKAFAEARGVEIHQFAGKHPSGNVGVQMHHISPLLLGKKAWTLGVQEVITLGALFTKGIFDAGRLVAITGHECKENFYAATYIGASIQELLKDNISGDNVRIISGDVLTGKTVNGDHFLNYRSDQITVITEGNKYELFGWLLPLKPRPSASRTFPNFLFPNYKFKADTNTHGERRAFVVSGQYEDVLPMNIYPQHLMKAILAKDIEKMEGLGIYELTEEDIAICEFVCTSKAPLQEILRDGLEYIKEQG
mgnify:CR=1 FL=1